VSDDCEEHGGARVDGDQPALGVRNLRVVML